MAACILYGRLNHYFFERGVLMADIEIIIGIIGSIIGVVGIITTVVSMKKAKTYTNTEFLQRIEIKDGKTISLYYSNHYNIPHIIPIIAISEQKKSGMNPKNDSKERIKDALKRENSIQILQLAQNVFRFRITALNHEVLFYSDEYTSLSDCKNAIKAFERQYT